MWKYFSEFFNNIQIPKPEKIISTEWNKNECCRVVIACSETESINGSDVVKNGLIALRYLKVGSDRKFNSSLIIIKNEPIIIIETNSNNPFLSLFFSWLIALDLQLKYFLQV